MMMGQGAWLPACRCIYLFRPERSSAIATGYLERTISLAREGITSTTIEVERIRCIKAPVPDHVPRMHK